MASSSSSIASSSGSSPWPVQRVKGLETANVKPNSSPGGEKSLPLTLYDLPFLNARPLQSVWFYRFPEPGTRFFDIPSLRLSLSWALSHYYVYAGHFLFPRNLQLKRPEINYREGDSVQCHFAESNADFDYITGDQRKAVSMFYPLIPQLPKPRTDSGGALVTPLLAIQVTLFPMAGVSFGFTMDHVVGDFASLNRFVGVWGIYHRCITKGRPPSRLELDPRFVPSYQRTMLQDPVDPSYWKELKQLKSQGGQQLPKPPADNITATFLLPHTEGMQRVIDIVAAQYHFPFSTDSDRLNFWMYIVACAHTWCCYVKSRTGLTGEGSGSSSSCMTDEYFFLVINPRKLLFPRNYFGNCEIPFQLSAKTADLIGKDGCVAASRVFGDAFYNRLPRDGVPMRQESMQSLGACYSFGQQLRPRERLLSTTGSLPFPESDPDFGLGLELTKREMVSIDGSLCFSLHKSKDDHRGTEIGLSLPKQMIDAFASVFYNEII